LSPAAQWSRATGPRIVAPINPLPRRASFSARMNNTVFTEMKFWLMVLTSVVLPFAIYGVLLAKRAISRATVLVLGFTLVAIAGLDIYFLQSLAVASKLTPSLADDAVFLSEISMAFYLLPAMFGGIGVNMISHVLVSHLADAERRFNEEHPDSS
jgi:hypothetical protein